MLYDELIMSCMHAWSQQPSYCTANECHDNYKKTRFAAKV